MKLKIRNKSWVETIVNITLMLLLFVPQSTYQYVLCVAVMLMCVVSNIDRQRPSALKAMILIALLVTFLVNAASGADGYGMSDKSLIRWLLVLFILLFFPFVKSHSIRYIYIYIGRVFAVFTDLLLLPYRAIL